MRKVDKLGAALEVLGNRLSEVGFRRQAAGPTPSFERWGSECFQCVEINVFRGSWWRYTLDLGIHDLGRARTVVQSDGTIGPFASQCTVQLRPRQLLLPALTDADLGAATANVAKECARFGLEADEFISFGTEVTADDAATAMDHLLGEVVLPFLDGPGASMTTLYDWTRQRGLDYFFEDEDSPVT